LLLLSAGAAYPQLTITPSNAFGSYPLAIGFTTQAYPGATLSTNGVGPTTWTVNGSFPPGLLLNPSQTSATITGTPTLAGSYAFTVSAFDPQFNQTVSQAYTINIVALLTITTPAALPNATLDTPYSFNFSASGGTPPYFWSVPTGYTTAVPPGLQVSNTGSVYGTPTQTGTFAFLVQVSDSDDIHPQTNGIVFSLTVSAVPTIASGLLPSGTLGVPYQTTLTVQGGSPPFSWQITAGSLPPGLILLSSGLLSGTPTQTGSFSFTALARDAWGASVSGNFTLAINSKLIITTKAPLTNGAVGSSYALQFAAAAGVSPLNWTVISGALPAGLSLNASTGLLSGTPVAAGTFRFTVQATDATRTVASASFSLTIAPQLVITTAALPNGKVGTAYTGQSIAATGGTPPYMFFVSAGFPVSLNLDRLTGAITGTPSQAGLATFTAQVTDAAGISATKALTINITTIMFVTPSPLPAATLGVPYNQFIVVTADTPPTTYTLDSGALPAGLTLETAGVLHGTPTATGTFQFVIRVRDQAQITTTQAYQLTVAPPAVPPPTITGINTTGQSSQQPTGSVQLASPYPLDLTVTFTLTFASAVGNVDDPTIQIANGTGKGNRTKTVIIPAGSTTSPSVQFSTGSVAGIITLTLDFQAAGQDVTPSPAPKQVIQIPAAVPVITSVTVHRTSSGLEVDVNGISNTRDMNSASFQFQAGATTNLQTSQVSVSTAGQLFGTWYSNPTSQTFGSGFKYAQQFTITGNMTGITSVMVTLTNSQGTSSPATASVQ
jgi:hypothetical protein